MIGSCQAQDKGFCVLNATTFIYNDMQITPVEQSNEYNHCTYEIEFNLFPKEVVTFAIAHQTTTTDVANFKLTHHMLLFEKLLVYGEEISLKEVLVKSEFQLGNEKTLLVKFVNIHSDTRPWHQQFRQITKQYSHSWNVGLKSSIKHLFMLSDIQASKDRSLLSEYPVVKMEDWKRSFYYFNVVLASYGWSGLNLFSYGNTLLSRFARPKSLKKVVQHHLNIPKEHILKFSGNAKAFKPAYFVIYDEKKSTIVVTVRGTMTLPDMVTDVVCNYYPWKGGYVHQGFYNGAAEIFKEIKDDIKQWTTDLKTNDIMFLGHSMGGSIAVLLSQIVKDAFNFANVGAITYGGAPVVSPNLLPLFEHVISCVNQNDYATRVSYGSLVRLRESVAAIEALKHSDVEKMHEQVNGYNDLKFQEMVIPGRVFWMHQHVEETTKYRIYKKKPMKKAKSHTIMQEVDPKELLGLEFGRGMLFNHLPNSYERSFLKSYQYMQEEKVQ